MPSIVELSVSNWSGTVAPEVQRAALESGAAVRLPNLPFLLSAEEQLQLNPIEGSSKNISWDPRRGVRGVGAGRDPATLNSISGPPTFNWRMSKRFNGKAPGLQD